MTGAEGGSRGGRGVAEGRPRGGRGVAEGGVEASAPLTIPPLEVRAGARARTCSPSVDRMRTPSKTRSRVLLVDCSVDDRLEKFLRQSLSFDGGGPRYGPPGADVGGVDHGDTADAPPIDPNWWSLPFHDRHAPEEDADPSGGPSSTPTTTGISHQIRPTNAAFGRVFPPFVEWQLSSPTASTLGN